MVELLQVARGVVDVWPAPGGGSDDDRLTQALLGCPATVLEECEGWARVRLPDYEGFVDRAALAPGAVAPSGEVLTVTARRAALYPTPAEGAPLHAGGSGAARRGVSRHRAAGCRPTVGSAAARGPPRRPRRLDRHGDRRASAE